MVYCGYFEPATCNAATHSSSTCRRSGRSRPAPGVCSRRNPIVGARPSIAGHDTGLVGKQRANFDASIGRGPSPQAPTCRKAGATHTPHLQNRGRALSIAVFLANRTRRSATRALWCPSDGERIQGHPVTSWVQRDYPADGSRSYPRVESGRSVRTVRNGYTPPFDTTIPIPLPKPSCPDIRRTCFDGRPPALPRGR